MTKTSPRRLDHDRRDGREKLLGYRATCQLCDESARWRSERPPMVFDGEIRH